MDAKVFSYMMGCKHEINLLGTGSKDQISPKNNKPRANAPGWNHHGGSYPGKVGDDLQVVIHS
jgi:hypothetical protein